jgi:hypothetical protein
MHIPSTRGREAVDVVAWRGMRLRETGFPATLADELARERAADVHALIELVEQGCPPALAARILAPLDHERQPC